MVSENIILQSAGSLAVGVVALLMMVLQGIFFFKRPQFSWYAWSTAISASALIYSIAIFLEYNTPAGSLNRFAGILEWMALICLIHCGYGFTFSYLGMKSKRYHLMVGVFHGLLLVLLWFTPLLVADRFVYQNFMGFGVPFVEPALGPLGPVFILYVVVASIGLVFLWMRDPKTDSKNRFIYVAGIVFWILLGFHDALAALGLSTFQYVMEYGFLGFALAVLWVVFNDYLEIAAEEKYRMITEFANDCIMVVQDEKVVFENPACRHFWGESMEASTPGDFLQMMPSEERRGVLDHFNTLKAGDRVPVRYAFSMGKRDAERRFMEIASSAIQYRNRPAILTVMRDITERKQAEDKLIKNEERLRIAGKVSYDLIYEWDVQNEVLEWFSDVDGFLGYPEGKISGSINAWFDIIHPQDRGSLEKVVGLHQKSTVPIRYRYRIRHHDGTYRHWKDQGQPLLNEKGLPHKWIGVCTDITESKQAEEALRETEEKLTRSRKMESIGLLAGGVAHDLNNVLSGIISYPELMLLDMAPDHKLRNPLERIQDAGRRAAAIVDDLLTVARGVAITKVTFNFNGVVRDYLDSPEFKKTQHYHPTVSVKTLLDEDLLNVNGSPAHVMKALMNLVSNASEAIDGKGNVTLSTMNRYLDRPISGYEDVNRGEYAVLSVSDDGSGISSDDLERIFEPFYTKKVLGRSGTGLGLAVVWNTVQIHEGYIDVKTDAGGTCFELYFPATRDELPEDALVLPMEDYMGRGERILVVDDEEHQRDICCRMLKTLGYEITAVAGGEEAVAYLRENTVDLVLLDMIMDPGLNGRETFERIVQLHPRQKAVIVSGFSETADVKAVLEMGAGQYVRKPVMLEKLGVAVRAELEK